MPPAQVLTQQTKESPMPVPTPAIVHLLSSELSFGRFMDEIPLATAVMDKDLNIVWLNRAFEALTGFSRSDAYGMPCRHVVRSRACVERCPRQNGVVTAPAPCESDIINRDRVRLPVKLNLAPLTDANGNHTGYMETIEDLRAVRSLDSQKSQAFSFEGIIGRSEKMDKIFQTLPILAQSDASILITGETGTGKDVVAEAIHQTSLRAGGPFVKVNCGALPETLLESELFGHAKGAFTGASADRVGRLEKANHGTVFLDEIGEPSPLVQVKLLRVLQERTIERIGESRQRSLDIRVITATHRNLYGLVKEGKFREDLYYRLKVFPIGVPPLRERKTDIPLLVRHFCHRLNAETDKNIQKISPTAMQRLLDHHWPGNVRELENAIEHAFVLCNARTILPDHLPLEIREKTCTPPGPGAAIVEPLPLPSGPLTRELLTARLHETNWNKAEAARRLGVSRTAVWKRMKQWGIPLRQP